MPSIFSWSSESRATRPPPRDRALAPPTTPASRGILVAPYEPVLSPGPTSPSSLATPSSPVFSSPLLNGGGSGDGPAVEEAMDLSDGHAATLSEQEKRIKELEAMLSAVSLERDRFRDEVTSLKLKLDVEKFGLKRYGHDDSLITFYTGFPNYSVLCAFMNHVRVSANTMEVRYYSSKEALSCRGRPRSLPIEDELFLFLTRLRLGLMEQDLADRFRISQSSVSRKVISWANLLYFILGRMPWWLDKAVIQELRPDGFRLYFPNTRIIIDCTEIRIQQPTSLRLSSQTYSHYKGTTTFKVALP